MYCLILNATLRRINNNNTRHAFKLAGPKIYKLKNHLSFIETLPLTAGTAVLLDAFFNSAPQYQVLLNRAFEIVAFNEHAFNFNYANGQVGLEKGKSIFDYIDSSLTEDFRIECGRAWNGEFVEYEHFVNGCWFDFTVTALYDSEENAVGLAIVGNKINDQKETTKIIRHQSESLSIIAQLQSHQVRHPVSSILGLVELIKEENKYPIQKEYIEALENATSQLDDIIRAIVRQSRVV
ncbi:hypothetical protein BH11BAC6_BH11BAC6_00590 [soil metagenome]